MAAYAALVSLLNNIHAITNHPRLSTSLDNLPIQPILEKTNFLLDFIEGCNYSPGSKELADLERQIASAAHAAEDQIESHIVDQINQAKDLIESNTVEIDAAEDLIDSHIVETDVAEDMIEPNTVDQIHEKRQRKPYLLTFLLKCVGCHISEDMEQIPTHQAGPLTDRSEESHDLQHIIDDMDAIIEKTNEFKDKGKLREEQQPTHVAESHRDGGESAMVGLDAELNQLLDDLTGDQSRLRIISIVGMGGTGKTTLAKHVYECKLIKEQFHCRAWATISQQNDAKEVLSKLVSCLGESSSETVDSLGLQLHKALFGRKYLIVLDDIWSVTAWDEVKRFFPDNQNRSRILLTTRLSNVARDCGSSLFLMNFLDDINSWKLFCDKVFQGKDCPSELREVGEEIVKSCKGLALSIVVIGGLLLKSPRTLNYWSGVQQHLKSLSNSKEKEESLGVLSLSYNHLPAHLKPCFLSMGVFKEDSEISFSRIIRLWVAEGFIKPSRTQILEEIAEGFIKDLIDRNLILGYKSRENGDIGSCGVHDLLRELCVKLAEQEEFFQVFDDTTQGIVHAVFDDVHLGRANVRIPRMGSIMTSRRSMDLTKHRLMRVYHNTTSSLEVSFYGNVNLRYLAYVTSISLRFEWKLLASVSFIWNLQSLIIDNRAYSLVVAPVEFWNMRQLRHVECRMLYVPGPPLSNAQDGSLMLENLQTFEEIVNLRLFEEVCYIISNIKDLHLRYDEYLKGYDNSFIESLCNLDRLHKLNSLTLEGSSKSLFPGRELEMKRTTSFPISLKKLSLTLFMYEWDELTIIGSLPQLEVLKLEFMIVRYGTNKYWSPSEGQFRRLKFLEINGCNLKRWDAEESHFPILEKLILINLNELGEIPLCIGNIPTLELIRVDKCSNSTAISAVRIKEDQLEYDNQLQVQVEVFKKAMESFNQMLEEEELTVDNIEFKIY